MAYFTILNNYIINVIIHLLYMYTYDIYIYITLLIIIILLINGLYYKIIDI